MLSRMPKAGGPSKSKKGPRQPTLESEESQDDTVNQLLYVTISAIRFTRDLVPINLVKDILGTVANILMIAQSVIKNKSDLLAIVKKCESIKKVLERATKDATEDDLQGSLGDALTELNISVNRMYSEAASKKEQRFFRRLFSATLDGDQITAWNNEIDRVLALFHFEVAAGTAIDVKIMKKLVLESKGNAANFHAPKYCAIEPPLRPAMLYGRDDLVVELANLVINDEHVALIGTGGMGKSSLAKAILNEPLVTEKFADRRFFVTYNDMDPSTITLETFMTRFAGALGMEIAGADPVRQVSTFLRSANALIVLDNAETFEDASASSALKDIPQAIAEMADIPGVILILTSRSRRNAPNVQWITKDIPPLDLSSAQAAFFRIYQHASRSEAEESIKDLLKELDCHPLSINILANAAQQNGWSPAMLLKRWNDLHSKVLDGGKGKLHSLSDAIQLSLNSPSIKALGEDGRRVLAIIAFLPQGLNEVLASDLLPSLSQVDTIFDVLCMQSLVYREDDFLKVLAPIRHYLRDLSQAPDSTQCLQDIRDFYYCTVNSCSKERDQYAKIVVSDHLNIEQVVSSRLAYFEGDAEETYVACWQFLQCLRWHLPRPTTLTPAISNIVESPTTWALKAHCFFTLAKLYTTLSQLVEASRAFQAAEKLYLAAGDPEGMGDCLITRADTLRTQGRYLKSWDLLEDLQRSDSWQHLSEAMKSRAWCFLDIARMYTFKVPADELFAKTTEDHHWSLQFKIWHWGARFYNGGDAVEVRTHLEDLLLQCVLLQCATGSPANYRLALEGLAGIAFCEGELSDAMDKLQTLIELFKGQDVQSVLWYTVWKAIAASKQENYDLARELIHEASEPFKSFALRNARAFLHRAYGSACIELTAGEYDTAESYFAAAIEACDMQSNLMHKAWSMRGLGEIASVRSNCALATQHFEEARALCTEMGVPPQHLYRCSPFSTLPGRFKGWVLFLGNQSPK